MNSFLNKFRTPILSFCIGVLFTITISWIYIEKAHFKDSNDEIIIEDSLSEDENNSNEELSIFIDGNVSESKVCKINRKEDIFTQIDTCVEFQDNADIESLKDNILSILPDNKEYLHLNVSSSDVSSVNSEVKGVGTEENCISLNNASLSELDSLPGIGSVYAQRIIDSRPFVSVTDIKSVKGIGDKTFSDIESLICL